VCARARARARSRVHVIVFYHNDNQHDKHNLLKLYMKIKNKI